MNKDVKDKGEKNVGISEVEVPNVEASPQNGDSDSEDWKKQFEREKLQLELDKIKAETSELKKPFYKRQAYLQFSIPAVISLLAVLASLYFGFLDRNIKNINEQISVKESKIKELDNASAKLQQENKDAQNQQNELNKQIKEFEAKSALEKKEKENIEKANAALEERQRSLDERIAAKSDQVEGSRDLIEKLSLEQEKIKSERAELQQQMSALRGEVDAAYKKVEISQMEALLSQFLVERNYKNKSLIEASQKRILTIYNENPKDRNKFVSFFEEAANDLKRSSVDRIRIASILYQITGESKWEDTRVELFRATTRLAVNSGGESLNYDLAELNQLLSLLWEDGYYYDKDSFVYKVIEETAYGMTDEQKVAFFTRLKPATVSERIVTRFYVESPLLFINLAETGVKFSLDKNEKKQKAGIDLLLRVAGIYTTLIMYGVLIVEGKISPSVKTDLQELLKSPNKRYLSKDISIDSVTAWKNWLDENKCLVDILREEGLVTLRKNPALVNKVYSRECS